MPDEHSEVKDYIRAQRDIVVVYLFGSVARGRAIAQSDLDIAVLLADGLDPEATVDRQIHLTSDLSRFSDREVQVTILNRASPMLAYQVVRDGQLLFERSQHERVAFEVNAMKRYFDVKPMLEFHSVQLRQRIQEVGLGRRSRRAERALEAAERIRERLARATDR